MHCYIPGNGRMRKMHNELPQQSKPSLHKAQIESCSGYRTWYSVDLMGFSPLLENEEALSGHRESGLLTYQVKPGRACF